MKKIHKLGLNVCLIFWILNCGCYRWDWKPDPYVGDSEKERLVNKIGTEVLCHQPEFEGYTCFSYKDMEALKINIEHCKEVYKRVEKGR